MPAHKPGDTVASRCTRCNDVTGHVIVALVGNEIVKVECRACGGVHRYRPPEGAGRQARRLRHDPGQGRVLRGDNKEFSAAVSPSAGRVTGARAARAAKSLEDEWRRTLALASASPVRPYAMQARFALGEAVEHPVFGSGIVREVLPPDKMRVLFRDGLRLLRCAC